MIFSLTQPLFQFPVFRGFAAPDAWQTKCTLPAFTDCRDVAEVYARAGGRVGEFRLAIERPLQLGDLFEDVVTIGSLRQQLTATGAVTLAEVDAWAEAKNVWRFDGTEIDSLRSAHIGGVPFDPAEAYTDTYRVADDAGLLQLARRAGFDGYLYRGVFVSSSCFKREVAEVESDSSYDDSTCSCLEVRPFAPEQIVAA